jgi:hypothetical protein
MTIEEIRDAYDTVRPLRVAVPSFLVEVCGVPRERVGSTMEALGIDPKEWVEKAADDIASFTAAGLEE